MSALSDTIEEFIKSLMTEEDGRVELQRHELAQHFSCAPSQINYVLATRFTVDRGYKIESRRGGGGYIRIIRLDMDGDEYMFHLLSERIGNSISQRNAQYIVEYLRDQKFLTDREAHIMIEAMDGRAIGLPAPLSDQTRAGILRAMILAALSA